MNDFALMDISQVTSTTSGAVRRRDPRGMTLTTTQVTTLTTWVNGGGNLIAMRPDKKLASLLGLTDAGSHAVERLPPGQHRHCARGLASSRRRMQFHGAADRYTLNGATVGRDPVFQQRLRPRIPR